MQSMSSSRVEHCSSRSSSQRTEGVDHAVLMRIFRNNTHSTILQSFSFVEGGLADDGTFRKCEPPAKIVPFSNNAEHFFCSFGCSRTLFLVIFCLPGRGSNQRNQLAIYPYSGGEAAGGKAGRAEWAGLGRAMNCSPDRFLS